MKLKKFTAIAITAMAIFACDNDDMGSIGSSLTQDNDKLSMSTGTYPAYSRSVLADSVYARNYDCYFGKVRDPETGTYVKQEFMAQFNMLEDLTMPDVSYLTKDTDGRVLADSCEIWLYFDKSASYGDTLAPIKTSILELREPMSDNLTYYSNYDPKADGFIRTDGLKKSTPITLCNLTYSDSIRNLSTYTDIARISLGDPYTDKNGETYKDYGNYILRNYYEHPEYFKNSYTFIHTICPGFYFEVSDGLGVMTKISRMELRVYYSFTKDSTFYAAQFTMASTPEVLQTNKVTNDLNALRVLESDDDCTYIKAPAGIFTEVTLPIDNIVQQHNNDSLLSVNITFQRKNSDVQSFYNFNTPTNLLMVQKDSLSSFFEGKKMYDYKNSFLATLSKNSYAFTNIGNLVTLMKNDKAKGLASDPDWLSKHPNWNKVMLVPVSLNQVESSDYYGNKSYKVTGVTNEMGLSSTKLVGGPNTPIDVKVIYAKFNTD